MASQETETVQACESFKDFDLEPRIIKGILQLKYEKPTLIQKVSIPLALKGKDILAKAKTGSGKTAAYCIPVVQKILSKGEKSTQALILVPTRELALQITQFINDLCLYCSKFVTVVNIAVGDVSLASQIPLLAENPHIIVSTPARISQHLEAGNVSLKDSLESLVIDEADLILSYGYDADVTLVLKHLPQLYQSYLMSATLSADVEKLKKLILRKPAILQLDESQEENLLTQYYINCKDEEKYLLTLFILKLRVHPFGSRKSLIFVNSIEKCYKLKLFLEQFGIKSCTLNSELPVKSRYHIVEEFNRGIYDYLIATDEGAADAMDDEDEEQAQKEDEEKKKLDQEKPEEKTETAPAQQQQQAGKKRKNFSRQDDEYGVSRGIDFKNVLAVINFDMPRSSRAYNHRVGRTARGLGNKGYALTFVCPEVKSTIIHTSKRSKKSKPQKIKQHPDEYILGRIEKRQAHMGRVLLPFQFDMAPVERFRYRCADALRSVTTTSIKDARIKELKMEILNSEKLKTHFEDHPTDLAALRHDKAIHPTKIQPHMRHVPDYLLPKGKVSITTGSSTQYVPFRVDSRRKGKKKFKSAHTATTKRRADPLKSFSYSGSTPTA